MIDHRRSLALGLAALLLPACGSTPDAAATDAAVTNDTGAVTTDAPRDAAVATDAQVGIFQVQLVAPSDAGAGYTSVVGRVQDGPTPAQLLWDTTATAGDCRLLVPRVPFCATPCGGSAVCVADDTCQPYPSAQGVGAVRVTGVRTSTGATTLELSSVNGSYQVLGDVTLPYPAFAEGDALRVEAAGSASTAAFAIEARGIAPLVLGVGPFTLSTGQPLALAWTASAMAGPTIRLRLDISHHGGTRGKVECDTADDGELSIAADLVTRLLALGVAGFPTVVVTRVATGTTAIAPGRVDLQVSSEVEAAVVIPDLRSCTSSADCDGGTCRADLTCE